MASSSTDVALVYAVAVDVGVLASAAALRGSMSSYVWASLAKGEGKGRWRRAGRWTRTTVALLLTGALGVISLLLGAAVTAGAAGIPGEEAGEWSYHRAVLLLGVVVGVALLPVVIGVTSARWIRRRQDVLTCEKQWGAWLEPCWQQRVPRAVAFAAWQARLVLSAAVVALLLVLLPFVWDIGRAAVAGAQDDEVTQLRLTESVAGLLSTVVAVGLVVVGTMLWRPDWYLAEHAIEVLRRSGRPDEEDDEDLSPPPRAEDTKPEVLTRLRGGPARWRSPRHRAAFAAAGALRRCIPRFRHRLTGEQYGQLALVAVGVSGRLREAAVTAHLGGAAQEQLTDAVRAAVALVFTDDLARTLDTVNTVFPVQEQPEHRVPSRTRLLLEGASESVVRYWPAVKVLLVVGVVVALVATGQLPKLVELLKG